MLVLVADDDPLVRHAVCAMVRSLGHPVVAAENGLAAWQLIQTEGVTLLITDWQMPGLDGPALIQRVRGASLPHYISCLLLTVRDRHTDRIFGFDAGADDYLVKPVAFDELRARLTVAERVLRLEQELRDANIRLQTLADQLRHQATHDHLTGLLNRHGIVSAASLALAHAAFAGRPLSVAILDVDHFKQVNDRYGHLVGDQALRHVAVLLAAAIGPNDMAGRWGGEEFLLVLPDTGLEAGGAVAEQLRAQVAATPLILPDLEPLELRVSIGVTSSALGAVTLDQLVAAADLALYSAKSAGRNRVYVTGSAQKAAAAAIATLPSLP